MKYPSSARHPVNWDALNVSDEETNDGLDKPKGEDALKDLFQKIYDQGSDDTRRAMIKSLQESGGTCLSTNWKEVGAAPVNPSPPDGCDIRRL